jgi:hypothetical protein
MITIWKFVEDNSWELIEEMQDDLALAQRLIELRQDGNEYRAEKRDGGFATVLGV